jgi:hypothetical protein
MQRSFVALTIWLTLGLVFAGCVPQPTQFPTTEPLTPISTQTIPSLSPSATVSPTLTPRPTSSSTQVSTIVPATDTPAMIPSPYPIPTTDNSVPLSHSGPWLSYMAKYKDGNGIITVVNADGSGRRQMDMNPIAILGSPVAIMGSPATPYLAVLIRQSEQQVNDYEANALEIFHLSEMSTKIIPLISSPEIQTHDYIIEKLHLTAKDGIELIRIAVNRNPAWSPNGAIWLLLPRSTDRLRIYIFMTRLTIRSAD